MCCTCAAHEPLPSVLLPFSLAQPPAVSAPMGGGGGTEREKERERESLESGRALTVAFSLFWGGLPCVQPPRRTGEYATAGCQCFCCVNPMTRGSRLSDG